EGFNDPLLFRTCAQVWVDDEKSPKSKVQSPKSGSSDFGLWTLDFGLPEGEQFRELTHWLEMGLTRLEIEAIKARGVSQLLAHLQQALVAACPPDLTDTAGPGRAGAGRSDGGA